MSTAAVGRVTQAIGILTNDNRSPMVLSHRRRVLPCERWAVSLAAWRVATRPAWVVYERPGPYNSLTLLDQRTGTICSRERCWRYVNPAHLAAAGVSSPDTTRSRDLTRAP